MSSKTKIIVLKSKELIYTGIFIVLGILLILLLWYMFSPKEDEKDTTDTSISTETFATYQPGVYTSQLNLGGTTLELQTTIDKHAVTHIEVSNTNETVTAMDSVTYASDNQYTTLLILEAARQAAQSARIDTN